MRAAILAVGSELLGVDRLDTNSLRLTEVLRRYGVQLVGKSVLGDSQDEIASWIRSDWLRRVDLLLVSGGLGPTSDDLTREAVAGALSRKLYEDPAIVTDIARKFTSMGLEMPTTNRCQAQVIDGAEVLANPAGTAPGLRIEDDGRIIFLFPGVPRELERMVEHYLVPWLESHGRGIGLESRSVRVACRSESAVEESLQPVYETFDPAAITVLAAPGDIEIRFTVSGSAEEREAQLSGMIGCAQDVLGSAVYTTHRDESLEAVVGAMLLEAGKTVATAESCTAGLLAERLTRVPGSSDYFVGGVVSYADRIKTELLGVSDELLVAEGAVSESVAVAMAEGVRNRLDSDFGIGITGIAGPGGGSEEKPVGTVHVAVAGSGVLRNRILRLPGDRQRIRRMSSQWALDLLRKTMAR